GSKSAKLSDQLREFWGASVTRRPLYEFSVYQAEKSLHSHFQVTTLAGFGFDDITPALCAAGEIVQYLNETQKSALGHLTDLKQRVRGDTLLLDHCTFRALEIERSLRGNSRDGTLLSAVDRTVHPIGARKLREWFCAPLTDRTRIEARQDAIAVLIDEDATRRHLREALKKMADVERIAARVSLNRATPRDLAGLSRTLQLLPSVVQALAGIDRGLLLQITRDLCGLDELRELLSRALRTDPPPTAREGGVIADGFDAELDRLRAIGHDGQTWLADYQRREIQRTGLTNLRIGFNRVFGYYLEISRSGQEKVPPDYVRRQTVKNAERYVTDELKQYETEVLTARERADELENRLFDKLVTRVREEISALQRVADAIGQLDCLASLTELAVERRYVRPIWVDDGRIEIKEGRHPVLEQALADRLVPNDTTLSPLDARVFVITGPNMAGKSTYIRQVALLMLMAQAGSFVPAKSMTCSIVDRVFARVGSADEIIRGQSTFMVEMTEAANILHNATDRSLVILDELGRGTSTFDGLALAWAITEHLANIIRCKTLVATHYHEMIELPELIQGVRNYNVAVREVPTPDGKETHIIFLHRIVEGGADKSYGLHVAKLAGVPNAVIQRSRAVLEELQNGLNREMKTRTLAVFKSNPTGQLILFDDPPGPLLTELRQLNVDSIAPLDALQRLSDWKKRYS
ncbi:MAG: DNA mismatch repair protein MutS, partial [Planctomycetota bacterium]